MEPRDEVLEKPHPRAPAEPARFAFLVGRWEGDARVQGADERWKTFRATWSGFTWRGERSEDSRSWSEFMVVELRRVRDGARAGR